MQSKDKIEPSIAVLIPCYNEEQSIAKVVQGFKTSLPMARIYVYDNNSTDRTSERASASGAIVRHEKMQGKGNVVRRMFADIEADVYVLVDGDGTYEASQAPQLVKILLSESCDMVTAVRDLKNCPTYLKTHRLATRIIGFFIDKIFKGHNTDIFSGYRLFSRRFVKSFPMISSGFEIETELTIHALELKMNIAEVKSPYHAREPGSSSKLRAFHDMFSILKTMMIFIKEERPLQLFSVVFVILAAISIGLGVPLLQTYFETGLVPRIPTAILSSALMLLAFLSFIVGLILSSVTKARHELKRLFYLSNLKPDYYDNLKYFTKK
jgi:glycosyltransferase involved in cell wall biosynthesis